MHKPDSIRLSAFESRWLSEAIRLREERNGPLDDHAVVAAARAVPGGIEARIIHRALRLGERDGIAGAVRSWAARTRLATVLLCGAAFASGFAAALAVLGDGVRPVNVVWALGGLLGVHIVSLLLWAAGMWLGGRDAGGALGRGWLWLSARLSDRRETVDVARALVELIGRTRLMRWWLGAVTHGLWTVALVGAAVGLLATLATRRYGFVWETTILPADVFVRLVHAVGWLPAQFGFDVPDAAAVRAGADVAAIDEAARLAWSSWLVGSLVAYGIGPRVALWGLCFGVWRTGRRRLKLDIELPGYAVLVPRLTPASERIGVTDADPGRLAAPRVAKPRDVGNDRGVLIGLELGADAPWPPELPPGVVDAGVLDSRDERSRLCTALRIDPPARLLIACDARQSPDRGSLELIAELSHHAGESRVLLLDGDPAADGDRRVHWRDGLRGIGMPSERVVESDERAFDWLAGARTEGGHA